MAGAFACRVRGVAGGSECIVAASWGSRRPRAGAGEGLLFMLHFEFQRARGGISSLTRRIYCTESPLFLPKVNCSTDVFPEKSLFPTRRIASGKRTTRANPETWKTRRISPAPVDRAQSPVLKPKPFGFEGPKRKIPVSVLGLLPKMGLAVVPTATCVVIRRT